MTDVVSQRQRELNRASESCWDQYAPHRARVTELICSEGSGRLVVLGAGNGNDLDVARLLAGFDEVHLVDLDGEAMAGATRRQGVSADPGLHLHSGIDVTRLPQVRFDRLKGADVVVSTTLLTQLLDAVDRAGGGPADLIATRDAHLRLLVDLLAPGGLGLLVTDVVSSDTCRQLRATDAGRLASLLVDTINAGDFFTGTNPFAIEQRLATDFSPPVRPAGVTTPWRWDIGDRSYLVCALRFRRP